MADFIYCLNSSTIRPTPILDKIAIAAEAGYGAIELWHDDIDAFVNSGGTIGDLRKTIDASGLDIPTTIMLKGWCDTTGEAHSQGLDECKRRLGIAAELGAIYAIAGPALGAVDHALAGANYRELLELGREFGVKPAMEYLGFAEDVNTIDDALDIMQRADHPDATIVLDPFHCFRGGAGFQGMSTLKSDQIAISHFNDAPATPPRAQQHDPDRVMPGEGHLDLNSYLTILRQSGYTKWLSLELFRDDLWQQDPRDVARVGLEKMRAVAES